MGDQPHAVPTSPRRAAKQEMLAQIASLRSATTCDRVGSFARAGTKAGGASKTFQPRMSWTPSPNQVSPPLPFAATCTLPWPITPPWRVRASRLTTPNPPGGLIDRDAAGQPTGVFRELAIGLVTAHIAAPSREELLPSWRCNAPNCIASASPPSTTNASRMPVKAQPCWRSIHSCARQARVASACQLQHRRPPTCLRWRRSVCAAALATTIFASVMSKSLPMAAWAAAPPGCWSRLYPNQPYETCQLWSQCHAAGTDGGGVLPGPAVGLSHQRSCHRRPRQSRRARSL